MRRKLDVLILCVLALAAAGGLRAAATPAARPQLPTDTLPDHVLYGQMFRHVMALDQQAEAVEKRGEDGSKLRLRYKQSAALSDPQERLLKTIARDCMDRVAEQDRKALAIIRAVRAWNPDRKLHSGQEPPAPPAELGELQEERNAIILAARDRLQGAFGQEEFTRLDAFLRQSLAPRIHQLSPAFARPPGHRRPPISPERQ